MNYIFAILFVAFVCFAGLFVKSPTPEQIDACVAASNYTAEECLIELTQ